MLAQQAAAGDGDARRALFERYRAAAYGIALRIVVRHEDALDVVQDSFIKAFGRLDQFHGGAEFRSWFLRIVTNHALDLLRARKVRLAVPLDGPLGDQESAPAIADSSVESPGRALEADELARRLAASIDSLPPQQRTVFSLYATGDMTYGQIAEALGVPVGTVMSRLYHARQKLQAALADLAPRPAGG